MVAGVDCGTPPVWPPDDEQAQPADLGPLPAPASWTGGLIGQALMNDLRSEGYTPRYVTEWTAACNWYVNCVRQQPPAPPPPPPTPAPGPGAVDPSSGDPAGEPGALPSDADYTDWVSQFLIEDTSA